MGLEFAIPTSFKPLLTLPCLLAFLVQCPEWTNSPIPWVVAGSQKPRFKGAHQTLLQGWRVMEEFTGEENFKMILKKKGRSRGSPGKRHCLCQGTDWMGTKLQITPRGVARVWERDESWGWKVIWRLNHRLSRISCWKFYRSVKEGNELLSMESQNVSSLVHFLHPD